MSKFDQIELSPSDMMKPGEITSISFSGGSIAGSVGKKQEPNLKPGINEDAGAVLLSDQISFIIAIDGHYEKDTTNILLDNFIHYFDGIELGLSAQEYGKELHQHFLTFIDIVLEDLQTNNCIGEASFVIVVVHHQEDKLVYFDVGDCMVFMHDPIRSWGKSFQVDNRVFYEWINKSGLSGYHIGIIDIEYASDLIICTDGLIDDPVISMDNISRFFKVIKNQPEEEKAKMLVRHALDYNEQDDNITVIYLNLDRE